MAEKKIKAHVSEEKIESVKLLSKELKSSKTIMIISIKNIASAQLQKAKKELRGKAVVRVAKKSIVLRAIDATGMPELDALKSSVAEDCAILMSNDDAFEIAAWLTENKSPVSAKEGQIADADITIEEGPTELVPGPVISELGAVGLQIMVEDGKITIRKSKVAVKKGDKVSAAAASIFQKLGIKPFTVGVSPMAFYDGSSKKVYVGVKIDKKKMLQDLVLGQAKALGFAVNIAYPSKSTIGLLLGKANAQANALNKIQGGTK